MNEIIGRPQGLQQRHLLIDGLNLARGGGVVVMRRIALAFISAGYRVTLLTARDLPWTDLADSDVEVIVEPKARGGLRAMAYRRYRLNALARQIGANALLGFNYHSQVALPQVTYHINIIPFLNFSTRCRTVGFSRAVMQWLAAKAALLRSTANIFESHYVRSLAARRVAAIRNPTVAYIGTEFPNQAQSRGIQRLSGPFVTVTSGARHKRNDLTIAFFRRMLFTEPDATLMIIGDVAAIRASLSKEDRDFADTSPAISFRGYISRDELYEALAEARALLVFSELESFFMVAIEAMSVGCPIIAADNTSIRESVGTAGLLVPSGDVELAVSKARSLTTPETFALYEEAGRDWASNFEANKCAEAFVAAFESAIWPKSEIK